MGTSRYLIALALTLGTATAMASEAEYEVTFQATWSAATHPQDFPSNPHFSGLIGGTHNGSVSFWDVGGSASPGIEDMAETGDKSPLDSEVNAAISAGTGFSLISGFAVNPSPGSTVKTFQMRSTHPLVTLVTMIAPSPDWFVGVSGLRLFENGAWKDNVVVDLDPYDSGTDSGSTFTSLNDDTDPQEPITNLSDAFPFTGTPPLGTFTFRLLSVTEDPVVPALSGWGLPACAVLFLLAGVAVMRRRHAATAG